MRIICLEEWGGGRNWGWGGQTGVGEGRLVLDLKDKDVEGCCSGLVPSLASHGQQRASGLAC